MLPLLLLMLLLWVLHHCLKVLLLHTASTLSECTISGLLVSV
jgi:hypothetical protein